MLDLVTSSINPPSSRFKGAWAVFAKPKDPVPKEQKSDAIYSILCNNYNQEYIGQTKRQFGTRLKEHQKAVSLSKKDNSAVGAHVPNKSHDCVG